MNDDGGIVINDMLGIHHVVYPNGFKLDAKALDPNVGGLAPKGEKVR